MHKPSGTTAVTAVLGILALAGLIWSKGAEPTHTSLQQTAPAQQATLGFGTKFELHTGAWRTLQPSGAETPPAAGPHEDVLRPLAGFVSPRTAAGAPADPGPRPPEAATGVSRSRSVPAQAARVVEPAAVQSDAVEGEPAAATPEAVPKSLPPAPSIGGRMGLAGPNDTPPTNPSHVGRAGPPVYAAAKTHERGPEPLAPPAPAQPKFGPEMFRGLDGVSF
jgi:hypothetical protein